MNKVDLLLDQIALIAGNPRAWSARFRSVDLADLAKEITALRAENEALKTVANFIIEYRSKNTRNFQLEKMDDFIRMLKELVQ